MKVGEQAELSKLYFWPKVQFGTEVVQIASHLGYFVARHVLG